MSSQSPVPPHARAPTATRRRIQPP